MGRERPRGPFPNRRIIPETGVSTALALSANPRFATIATAGGLCYRWPPEAAGGGCAPQPSHSSSPAFVSPELLTAPVLEPTAAASGYVVRADLGAVIHTDFNREFRSLQAPPRTCGLGGPRARGCSGFRGLQKPGGEPSKPLSTATPEARFEFRRSCGKPAVLLHMMGAPRPTRSHGRAAPSSSSPALGFAQAVRPRGDA